MRDRMTTVGRRVVTTFGSFTPGQKAMTVFAVIALAVGGYFFSTWAAKPTYAPLFSNLAPADASAIVEKLTAEGTPYELAAGGQTIMVPQDQVYDLRLRMSGEGLPAQAETGYALLDKQNVMTSEFMQKVGYQRALEGELAKTIKSIKGVQAATVHLAIPAKDVFTENEDKTTASVLVSTAPGKRIGADQVQSIVHLVSSSVEGLQAEDVSVVGADGTVLSSNGQDASAAAGDQRTRQTQQFEQRMAAAVQRMVDQVVGSGHAVVQVTADLDYDQTETKKQTYVADPNTPPLAETKKTETYTGGGPNAATGVLGPDNIQVPGNNGAGGGYELETSTRNNAVGVVTETRRLAPGAVRKLSVAVLLDRTTGGGANEAQLQQLVSSAVGLDLERGDTIAVTAMPFDQTGAAKTENELAQSTKAEEQAQLYSLAKTGALVGAILILVIVAMLSNRRRNKRLQNLVKAEVAQFNGDQPAIAAADAAALEADGDKLAIEPGASAESNVERDSRHREIADLVEKQPDEVAVLLRGWLADRRS